ncbi:hypothetical protein [Hirschia maritima]|uniref:hypothetical protein n=1 Tax=Hirschia maritima TaxID=1121961 RepID=UPI000376C890|nr:hypothetical protein [Hirschia maritima]
MVMLKRFNKLAAMVLCAAGISGMADAQEMSDPAKDASVQDVLACRALASNSERLACLDQAMPALEAAFPVEKLSAQEQLEITVRQNEQTQKAAEKVFGQSIDQQARVQTKSASKGQAVSNIERKKELKQIASQIVRIELTPLKKAIVYLENGQVWKQLEADDYIVRVKSSLGKEAVIKKKLLGGYTLRIGNKRAFRVQRLK